MAPKPEARSISLLSEVFTSLCICIDSPRSLKASLLVKYGEWDQLADFRVEPIEYNSRLLFSGDYLVSEYLRKCSGLPSQGDPKAAALRSFIETEGVCRQTNARIRQFEIDGSAPSSVNRILHSAHRKISRLLSRVDPLAHTKYSWGPGASFCLNRRRSLPDAKLIELPLSCTPATYQYAEFLINQDLHWSSAIQDASPCTPRLKTVLGGRWDSVPKTCLTDRSILVEPRANSLIQKIIGANIRSSLKRVGVDLDDQSQNQVLAGLSTQLDLCTIDLSSASDTVSCSLVEHLLPPLWLESLDRHRSRRALMPDGSWLKLEKFSSMGNGFTFELESLIFWALTEACADEYGSSIVGIYGDDIICHRGVAPLLLEVLSFCGFSVNKRKTFLEGRFFESCGYHYFDGFDVTPVNVDGVPRTLTDWIQLHNSLVQFQHRCPEINIGGAIAHVRRLIPCKGRFGPFRTRTSVSYLMTETASDYRDARSRSSGFGPEYRVLCREEIPDRIPAHEPAMLALWFQSRGQRCNGPPIASSEAFDGCVSSRVGLKVADMWRWVTTA